jgi:hypothetical protein
MAEEGQLGTWMGEDRIAGGVDLYRSTGAKLAVDPHPRCGVLAAS